MHTGHFRRDKGKQKAVRILPYMKFNSLSVTLAAFQFPALGAEHVHLIHLPDSLSGLQTTLLSFWIHCFPCSAIVKENVKCLVMSDSLWHPWTVACQVPLSIEFSNQEYWSGLPFPSPGDILKPVIKPGSPASQADSLLSEPPGKQ